MAVAQDRPRTIEARQDSRSIFRSDPGSFVSSQGKYNPTFREAIYPASWLGPDAFHVISTDCRSVLVRLTDSGWYACSSKDEIFDGGTFVADAKADLIDAATRGSVTSTPADETPYGTCQSQPVARLKLNSAPQAFNSVSCQVFGRIGRCSCQGLGSWKPSSGLNWSISV